MLVLKFFLLWRKLISSWRGAYNSIAHEFKSLVSQPKFSDITFVVGGKEIPAHKVIVFNRCDYLRKYVQLSDLFKGDSDKVEIKGVDYYPFIAVIHYLYTDQLKTAPHHVEKIFNTALKYELPRLAMLCKKHKALANDSNAVEIPPSTFGSDLLKAINNDEYSDIKINISDGTTIHAHKSILSTRSEYFSTIFGSSFLESGSNIINIKEVELEIFTILLKFIYSNAIEIIPDKVVDILVSSSRFLLEEMKQRIEIELEKDINHESVVDMLLFSDGADTPKLKKACISYVVDNYEKLTQSPNFDELRNAPLHELISFLHNKKNFKTNINNDITVSF